MKQGLVRDALLATSSALALIVGIGGSAQAQCVINNQAGAINNTTTINCISFNNGATFSGPVTNASNGTINANGAAPPSRTAIGVTGNSTLTGSITNVGTITALRFGIDVGLAGGGSVGGSITNNGSITAPNAFFMRGGTVAGSVTNNTSITSTVDVGMELSGTSASRSSIGGSVTNNGTIGSAGTGIFTRWLTLGGSIVNATGATIDSSNGFAGMEIVNSTLANSMINSGTITLHSANNVGMFVDATGGTGPGGMSSIAGSVVNNGTINATAGMAIQGRTTRPSVITGNFANSSAINASVATGIAIYSATIGGAVLNSGSINAAAYGILVLNFTGNTAGATVAGGISNSGTITSTGSTNAGIALAGAAAVANGITNTANGNINAQGAGILVNNVTAGGSGSGGAASVAGGITNQGTISAKTGIVVAGGGVVTGGITNSGNITGTGGTAIDVTGAGAATVINQQAGTITGNIRLSGLGDTVNVTGGALAGNVVGTGASGTVNFALGGGTFSYANAISGVAAVNVSSGTLFDNNSIAAMLVRINGGALAPGQPGAAGTLNVTGNLIFASAAAYLITINGANAGRTAVTGAATPGGASVRVASGSTINFGQTYTILTATGGVSGTFNPVVTFGNLTGTLTYDAHDVFLSFNSGGNRITPLLPPGSPQNVLAVAGALDNFLGTGGTPPPGFLNLFNLTPQQLVNALTQLSGEAGTGAQQSGFQLMSSFLALLTGPAGGTGAGGGPAMPFAPERAQAFPSDVALAYASVLKAPPKAAPHWTTWGAAFGGSNSMSGDPTGVGSHDMTAHAGAVAAGADYHVSRDTIVGFSLAGGGTSWGLSAGLGGGRSDAFLAGLYGSQRWGQAYLSGALTYTSYWMSTNRTITVAGADTLNASFNAWNFGGRLEGGFVAWSMPFRVIPYAAVQAQSFRSPAYSETGSLGAPDPFALSYAAQTATVVRSELGSRFDHVFAQADGSSVDLFGRAAWAHDWQSNPNLTATFIGLPLATFVVNGAAPPKDLALVTAGAEWRLRNGWAVMGKFDGEIARGSRTYTGTAKVSYTW